MTTDSSPPDSSRADTAPESSPDAEQSARRSAVVEGPDPELEALPEPRRPGRKLTLLTLSATVAASLWLAFGLRYELGYALSGGRPADLGNLARLEPTPGHAQRWVRAEAALDATPAVRYARPLEGDSYRLAPVENNPTIWVQVRVPGKYDEPHFLPPSSFVGRLLPLDQAGIRYASVSEALDAAAPAASEDAWLLVDGEAPESTRWVLGLFALFALFGGFSVYGLVRLSRPVTP